MVKLMKLADQMRVYKKRNLRRTLQYVKDYIHALETIKDETLKVKSEKIMLDHQNILKPYIEATISNDDYLSLKIKKPLDKILHRYHLKLLRHHVLYKKGKNNTVSIIEMNQAMQQEIDQLEQKVLSQRVQINDAHTQLEQKKHALSTMRSAYLEQLENKLTQQTKTKQDILNKKLHKLNQKLTNLLNKDKTNTILKKENILEVDHLTMAFGGLKAVDDLSFDVKKGEIFGLIGPNGAGKTTVFNCITQFYQTTHGDIYFENKHQEHVRLNDIAVHNVIHEGVARTFQNVELVYELNVLDNLLVGAHALIYTNIFKHMIHSRDLKRESYVLKQRAQKILIDLGLYLYKDAYPIGLPYGILKKIELARVLMTQPKLIILDEPAAGLNEKETQELAEIIQMIRKKYDTTVFLVEHDMGLVMDICDRICAISFGKKIAIGTPQEIQNHPDVQEAYLGGEADA